MGRRVQGTEITLHGGPAGEFSRGLVYQGLEKALEMGTFLHRGPVENRGGGPFTGNSDSRKGAQETGQLSLYGRSVKGT